MPPPLAAGRKTRSPLSASPDSSPGSTPRPFSFGDLGRPRPDRRSARLLPPIPEAAASGPLEELSADDILESNDIAAIDAFEMAAADIDSFPTPSSKPPVAAASSEVVVAEMGAWDEVEVEGLAMRATEPSPPPAASTRAQQIEPAPVSMKLDYASPQPSTLIGMPPAPVTSPLPLEDSVIVADFPERTLELKPDTTARVAAMAAQLDNPEQTQVLVRARMPSQLQGPATLPTGQTPPPPTSLHTPSRDPRAPHAHASGRPGSISPVALDSVDSRSRIALASIPAAALPRSQNHRPAVRPAKSAMSGLLIGGLAFAAAALIGVVGVGGYFASRTFSTKGELAIAPAPEPAAVVADDPVAAPADPAAAAGVDVSSLPSAPAPGALVPGALVPGALVPGAPRAANGAGGVAPAAAAAAPRSAGGSRASGGSSPAPSGRTGSPLAAPGGGTREAAPSPAATTNPGALPPPPPKAAPAAGPAAVASTTGTVSVDPKLRAVVVDGAFRHVNDGVITLSCGSHRIKVGMNDVQTVNVPCGGSISL